MQENAWKGDYFARCLINDGRGYSSLLQYNSDGTLGSQPGVSSVSCQSYNKGSNWLNIPTYYLFINTISNNELVGADMITLIPHGFHISNYIALKDVQDFGNSVLITISRTILGTALMVLCSAFAGYLTTKREMWKRSLW